MAPRVKGKTAVNRSKESTSSGGKAMNRSKTPAHKTKRESYISWDRYFMGVALISAQRSKDPRTQVGACIVNKRKRIVGTGYNGMPDNGIKNNDKQFSWSTGESVRNSKYHYVCHAEMNAIMNKMSADIQGCTVYTTLYPCCECSKLIIQSGIKKVVYLENKYPKEDAFVASEILLEKAKIKSRKYVKPKRQKDSLKNLLQAFEQYL